jgi:threonine dehydrogenase-like Zn-dependent dehydrogenase
VTDFPIGILQQRNLGMRGGNANHLKYVKELVELTRRGSLDPQRVLTKQEPMTNVIEAYKTFDRRRPGWVKVELTPAV